MALLRSHEVYCTIISQLIFMGWEWERLCNLITVKLLYVGMNKIYIIGYYALSEGEILDGSEIWGS
jgi:hypothetical protein